MVLQNKQLKICLSTRAPDMNGKFKNKRKNNTSRRTISCAKL